MGVFLIPTSPDTPFYTQSTPLSGTTYVFDFSYNQRENCWYFSIADSGGDVLAAGIKVVCGRPLIGQIANRFLPPGGEIFASSVTNDDSPPGLGELGEGRRVELIYLTPDN